MANRFKDILRQINESGLLSKIAQSPVPRGAQMSPPNMLWTKDIVPQWRGGNAPNQPPQDVQSLMDSISMTRGGIDQPTLMSMVESNVRPQTQGQQDISKLMSTIGGYTDDNLLTPEYRQQMASYGANMPVSSEKPTLTQAMVDQAPITYKDSAQTPTADEGFQMGDLINWGLVAGLNEMRHTPSASINTMAQAGLKAARSRGNVNKTIALLKNKALDPSVDVETRRKIFHNLDMMSANPDLAEDLQKDTLSLITGQTDPSDIKVYEPRVDEQTGEVYIPTYNKTTGRHEKKYLGVNELTKKQKIALEIDEKLRGEDLQNKAKAYNETFIKAQNVGDNISRLESLIVQLDEGATTGFAAKWLPAVKSQTAMFRQIAGQLGLDIVGSVTFGALSEKELALAMSVAVPPDLGPAEMKKWAEKRIVARQKLQQELLRRVDALGKATSYKEFLQGESDLQQRHINASWWSLDKDEQNALVGEGVTYNQWTDYNLNDRERLLNQLRK